MCQVSKKGLRFGTKRLQIVGKTMGVQKALAKVLPEFFNGIAPRRGKLRIRVKSVSVQKGYAVAEKRVNLLK